MIAYNAGLLHNGDVLSVHDSLVIRDNLLIDLSNSARHQLSNKAIYIIRCIQNSVEWSLAYALLTLNKLSDKNIIYTLNFLDEIGALVVKRRLINRLYNLAYRVNLIGHFVVLDKPSHRYSSNSLGLSIAVASAISTLTVSMLVTDVLAFGINISLEIIITTNLLFLTCLFVSTFGHEYLHIKIAYRHSDNPTIIQRGARLGILHKTLPRKAELISAICGPMCGVVISLLLCSLVVIDDLWFAWIISVLVASFHLLSWLPMFGDGAMLIGLVKRVKSA